METIYTGLHHIGVYARDREEAIDFYTDILGGKLLFRTDSESDGEKIAMIDMGDFLIEVIEPLMEKERIRELAQGTMNHFAVKVDDIEKAAGYAKSCGYEMEEEGIYAVPNFGAEDVSLKVAFIHGINGERIEFFQVV